MHWLTLFESLTNQKPGYRVPLWLWHRFNWWNVHGTTTVRSICTHNSERKQGEPMEKEDLALKATRDNVTQTTATTTLSAFPHVKQKNLKIPPEEQQLHDSMTMNLNGNQESSSVNSQDPTSTRSLK